MVDLENIEVEKISFSDIRRRVGMLVTNFVQRVWQRTQGEYLQGVEESIKYVWFTVGDDRTCPICEPNHGRSFKTMGAVMEEYPPHAQCRCWIEVEKDIRPMQRFQWTPPAGWD